MERPVYQHNYAKRQRNYTFTWNNYPEDVDTIIKNLFDSSENYYKCICYAKEIGASGTPHLQGFFVTTNETNVRAVIRAFPHGTHIQQMKGKINQNVTYCSKESELTTLGKMPEQQGLCEKRRWEDIKDNAIENKLDDIPADVYIRCYKTLKTIALDHMKKPENLTAPVGVWIHGKSGAGKTYMVHNKYPDLFVKDPNKWWDGYNGQEVVLIDDMDPFHKSLSREFKLWLDQYAFRCEAKGSMMWIRPKKVIVTSQYTIEEIWEDDKTRDAISRRCKIIEVHENDRRLGVIYDF